MPPQQIDRPAASPADRLPPGSFVNGRMRDECARFLEEVRSLVHRRAEQQRPAPQR
ncbi:MAG TPA: hypothetical protein VFL41_03210 [Gaiellaceae bacterium]|nr:hypothetical protein [Gaiellaceae bacterium]